MEKKLARQLDTFLTFLVGAFETENKISEQKLLESGETMGINRIDTKTILAIIVADGFLEEKIIRTKDSNWVDYRIKPELRKFIFDQGGYKKKRLEDSYEKQNKIFTNYRHKIWFFGFVASVILNIYFLAIYVM